MAITDLTGTVWYLNSSPSSTLTQKNINFYSNNKLWKSITCDRDQNQQNYYYSILYHGTIVYDEASDGWDNVNYRKIYIVDGTDVTNSTLITWLQTNAGLITTSNEYITYANDMKFVAQAIRAKGNTSSGLNYPLGFVTAIQNIPTGGTPTLQAKTNIAPLTTSQTIQPDSGYDGLSSVQINAMPSGSVTAPSLINGSSATIDTSPTSIALQKTISITPDVTTAGYISSGTPINSLVTLSANCNTKGATTYTPTTTNQSIAANTYLIGIQTISGDTNLKASNIKNGVSIFGVTGTYTGGGSSSAIESTLLGSLSLGTISTSSTTDTDTGKTITVKGIYDYDLLVCQCRTSTPTNGRHTCTTRLCWLTASSSIGTKNGSSFATATWNTKKSSSGVTTSRTNTTSYGVYAKAATVSAGSSGDNGQAVITIYQRYNSTQTGTINGSYTMYVYGLKIYDLMNLIS